MNAQSTKVLIGIFSRLQGSRTTAKLKWRNMEEI